MRRSYYVNGVFWCGRVDVEDGVIVAAAPIAKRTIGKKISVVVSKYGWKLRRIR